MSLDLDKTLKMEDILASGNVGELLSNDDLDKIGDYVHEGYTTDKESRQTWEEQVDDWVRLALQVSDPKSHPWPGAANVTYPLITTAALQFSARAYPSLLPGTNPVRGRVVGYDLDGTKTERAIRVGKHMSYQILHEMEDWEEEMDRLLFALPIVGTMFKKTYYDSVLQRNVSEVVYPKELVVNYWAKNLEDAQRITHVLKMSENDIYERVTSEIYLDADMEEGCSEEEEENMVRVSDLNMGVDKQDKRDETSPYIILEQCVALDLDGDDYYEPYVVTIDEATKKILRIVPRFTPEDVVYQDEKTILKIDSTNYYTKFSFIPSPDGSFYDLGFGVLLGPINKTINTLMRQLLDAGTLSNMQSGFISKGIRIKGGNSSFTPGEWKYVNSVGDDLNRGLVPLPVREPSQVLFSLLGMMIESGEKLSSVSEVMTGQMPGQNTKATVAMAAIEQGMKVFSSIYKRIHRSLSKEYKKLFSLNATFLPPESYFTILDLGQEGAEEIKQLDYAEGDVDILPTSDPNVATQEQRLSKIEAAGQMLELGTVNPQEYTKRYLEATEQPDVEGLMQMPDQGPSVEQQQFEFEKEKWEEEKALRWAELEYKEQESESKALLNIANAEAAEEGDQLQAYEQLRKALGDNDLTEQKLAHLQELHQEKMREQQEAHQQKMAQQQQNAQQGQGAINEQPGAEGL